MAKSKARQTTKRYWTRKHSRLGTRMQGSKNPRFLRKVRHCAGSNSPLITIFTLK